jgi:type I restriction enzyme, S subunit
MSFPRYPKYRDSGIAWIGEIPEHWNSLRLANIFRLQNRAVRDSDKIVTAFRDGQVTLRSERREEGFTNALKETGYQGIRKGDLVIHAMDAFAGAIGVAEFDGKSTPVYSVCTPISAYTSTPFYGLLLRYMALSGFINSLAKGIRERSTDFRWTDARTVLLPVPSSEEQALIVAFLDHETAKIDALIEEQQRLIELLKEKHQAVISRAVTRGLDRDVSLRDSGVDWIGKMPGHWSLLALARVTESACDGPFGSGLKSDHYKDAGVRVIRLQNIRNGHFSGGDAVYVDFAHHDSLGDHCVIGGDLLIAGLGDENYLVGRACVAPKDVAPAMVKADCFRFRLLKTADPDFIAQQLTIGALADGRLATGSTRSRIPLSKMAGRLIALPPIDEQRTIVDRLQTLETGCTNLRRSAERMVELLQERRSALVSAAITGKIDVRDYKLQPSATAEELYEPA